MIRLLPLLPLLWLAPLRAGAEAQDPIAFLQTHDLQVQRLLARSGDSLSVQARTEVKNLINGIFDFAELSRLALGEHWATRTADEQAAFVSTFSGIIREKNFDAFVRYYREGEIAYKTATVEGARAVVAATVPVRDSTVEILYHLHRPNAVWRIYDLTIDGASTVQGYQRQYARFLKKQAYGQLMERLNKQWAALRKNS